MENSKKPKIVIVGAGFAGLATFNRIYRKLGTRVDIILIHDSQFFEYTPSLHVAIYRSHKLKSLVIDLKEYYGENFVLDRVEKIEDKKVHTESGASFSYDYLVMATGSRTNFYGNQSFEKNTFPVRKVKDVIKLNELLPQAKNIVVVGGGYAGVEITSILLEDTSKKITLVHAQERLLENLDMKTSKQAHDFLASHGVSIYVNHKAMNSSKEGLTLDSGEIIPADLVIFCAGIKANDELIGGVKPVEKEVCLVEDHDIFVPGDASMTGRIPTAHNATIEGYYVGDVIAARIQNKTLPLPPKEYISILAVAFGRFDGVISFAKRSFRLPLFVPFAKWIVEKFIIFQIKHKITLPF